MTLCIGKRRSWALRSGLLNTTAIVGISALISATTPHMASADDLTWDSEAGVNGLQNGGGVWEEGGGSNQNWQDQADPEFGAPDNNDANTRFNDGDTVTFQDLGGSTATIDLGETVAPAAMTFDSGGFTIGNGGDTDNVIAVTGSMSIEIVTGDATFDAALANGGTVTINGGGGDGTLILNATNDDGDGGTSATYQLQSGGLTINGSTAAGDAVIVGTGIAGDGTLTIDNGGSVLGTVTLNNGTFNNVSGSVGGLTTITGGNAFGQGGSFDGGVTMTAGALTIQADTTGDVTNNGGTLTVEDGDTLTGAVDNESGTTNNNGTIDGQVTVTGGTLNNGDASGTPTGIIDGDVLVNGGTLVNSSGSDITGAVQIGTDDGTNAGGTVDADSGTFGDVVIFDGDLNVNAVTTADNVTNNGGTVTIDPSQTLTTDFSQTSGNTVIGAGSTLDDTDGTVEISGGTVENDGLIDDAVTISDGGSVRNDPTGTIAGNVILQGDGDGVDGDDGVLQSAGGTLNGTVTVDGGIFDVDTSVSVSQTTVNSGVVDVAAGQTLTTDLVQDGGVTTLNTGSQLVDADGVDVTGGVIENAGLIGSDITISGGGEVSNNSGGNLTGLVTANTGGTITANGGSFGGNVLVDGGAFDVDQTASVTQTQINDGTITIDTGATLTTELVQNGGLTNVDGGTLDHTGAGGLSVTEGTLRNAGSVLDNVTVDGNGTVEVAGGTFTALTAMGGNINVTADSSFAGFDLVNMGSDITISQNVDLTDDVTHQSGTLSSSGHIVGTLDLTGGSFTQNADTAGADGVTGAVTVSGAGTTLTASGGTFASGITASADGQVTIDGATTGDVVNNGGSVTVAGGGNMTGDLTQNTGASEIETGGRVNGDIFINGGTMTSDGVITGAGANANAVVLTDGTFTTTANSDVQGTTSVTGGVLQANGGEFEGLITGTAGDINIGGAVGGDISVEGTDLTIAGGAVLTGDVTMTTTSTQEAENNGTLNGTLTSEGGVFQNNGAVTGGGGEAIVMNGGTVSNNVGGSVTGTSRVRNGNLIANGGSFGGGIIVTDDGIGPTSTFTVAVDTTADITNGTTAPVEPGGIVTINAGRTLTGDVTNNSGDTIISGTVNGTVDVVGGMTTVNAGGGATGLASVTGGTLDALGGTFGQGILASGGQTNVDGTITISSGALTGDDGIVAIGASGIVNGNVTSTNSGGADTGTITNAGRVNGTVLVQASTFSNSNLVDGAVSVTGGTATNAGTIRDGLAINGGLASSSGLIQDGVAVSGAGNFTLQSGGQITGASTVTSGDFTVDGGTFNDGVTNNGGTIQVNNSATGNITNTNGMTEIAGTATLTGSIDNETDGDLLLLGTLNGALENNGGTVDSFGIVQGTTLNTGTGAELNVDVSATFGGLVTNRSNAALNIDGTLVGNVRNQSGGTLELTGGVLNGTLNNSSTANFTGASSVSGFVTNSGAFDLASGSNLSLSNAMTNQSGGVLDIVDGSTFSTASGLVNRSGGIVNLAGTMNGDLDNAGRINFDDGVIGGNVDNSGTVMLQSGALTFGGNLRNDGLVDVSTNAPLINDVVQIDGGLSGDSRFLLDINLSDDDDIAAGETGSDMVRVNGPVTGTVTLDFNLLATNGRQNEDVLVLDVDGTEANDFDVDLRGLPDQGEAIIYVENQITDSADPSDIGDVYITDALNPGIGALAGSIVLTQSLIGSVINRPSSPFVSGLAYDDPDPCGPGTWARGIAGEADSSGRVTELSENGLSFDGEISATYNGFQVGGDLACFNGYFDGWDISVGGIAGLNMGSTEQPVFGLVGDGSGNLIVGDDLTSVTTVDFDQKYGGVYLTGAYDRFAIDLQYRVEQTEFVADNVGVGGSSGLGLNETDFSSEASTFSGSVSYAIPFGESNVSFVPTAGFAYTTVSTDLITFNDSSSVQVEDFTSETLFVGGTISRTSFGADGSSALNQFVTATYYNDFADAPTSVFTPRTDTGQDPRSVIGENLGGYAELSAGLNYLRILPVGAPAGAKQISASIRGDLRSSDQLDSWGVTGQLRIQF